MWEIAIFKVNSMRTVSFVIVLFAALTIGAYLILRQVGLDIKTTTEAFAIPATENLIYKNSDGATASLLDITPAPWPAEAVWIFRWAQIGVPVNITVNDVSPPISFVISGINHNGHLIVIHKNSLVAESSLRTLGLKNQKKQ